MSKLLNNELIQLTDDQISKISTTAYLKDTEYYNLDFEKTLQYIVKRYITPIKKHIDIAKSSLVDCGAGFGWLAFGYILSGGEKATLCDIDEARLDAAKEISQILGIYEKCNFISGPMESLNFKENEFDIFASVETLEHVGEANIDACIKLIANSSKKLVVLTTPNKLFPLVLHDNKIPMSHWVPSKYRSRYTKLFGVTDRAENDFVSPFRLRSLRRKFRPISTTLTFTSYNAWYDSYPFYSPYNFSGRWKEKPHTLLKILYFTLNLLFGTKAYYFSPNLCRIWIKK